MDLGLKDKVAIVTGSGRGLGAATARCLAREGARVVLTDIEPNQLEITKGQFLEQGLEVIALRADITKKQEVDDLVAATVEKFGGVHILVNNAGFPRDRVATKMTEEDWDLVIEVILKGSFLACKAVLPHMIEHKWGRIINISSRAYFGNPGQANYSAAKAGLLGLTRALSLEDGKHNITVNAVAPGFMETEAIKMLSYYEKIRELAIKNTPMARTGLPDDIADAVAFLASERASFITGETLHVTGGRYG
ncbi:SDR family oxidoreductase [Paralcaligenes sp. KSB-10]|uniref:SDR family NAD(P)-dependent oxidoreductase n=1 Tax=Paralcaligenes sp. KSB-10 TaxID=2901142 RepID=UPI001E4A18FD|nr:SDR family NAD(P)-dependent oxidoreductase [Paralcaligenes sp. KSB-10]UHL65437.1 SDR family oxidoreductase [Paralcaligenes sp. KSB-10]